MRQTEGSVVCPECGRLVDVDAEKCPHCGRWRPGLFGFATLFTRTFGAVDVSSSILWACVVLYAASLALDPRGALSNSGREFLGLLSPGGRALYQLGMTGGLAERMGAWYTVFSATFLHGSLLHILFNMLWLRMLATPLEDMIGPARFFILYAVAGAGGFVVSNVITSSPTVGASGAIFGLLAAHIVLGRHYGGSWGEAISQRAMMFAGLLFVWGFLSPTTNNAAHAGGFIVGFVMTRLLVRRASRPEGPVEQLVAVALALLTVGAVVISFVRVGSIRWLS